MNSESFPGTQHHRQEGEGETEKGGGRQTQTLGGPRAHFLGEPRRGSQGWCLHGEARAAAQKRGAVCVCVCVCRRESVCPFARAPATSHALRHKLLQILRSFIYLMCFGFVFTVHNLLCRHSQPLFPPVCHLFTVAHLDY